MSDAAWVGAVLTAARPQVLGALLRYFRVLDSAEAAYREACRRALRTWPVKGLPPDPAAWLILVGRNYASVPGELAERHCRDDILELLFVCCHPRLPATQQIALALRIVSGLSVREIAHAFLIGESAMEQRITRAKARINCIDLPFAAPERLAAVSAMIYLLFNEGYVHVREPLCAEAIRLGRLLLRLFPTEEELMGLLALLLLQHARAGARRDADNNIVLLEDQDRTRWDSELIAEGVVLVEKALRHRRVGPYQAQAAIAAVHSRAEDTDWEEIDRWYQVLEALQPSPVVTLNRAVAVAKLRGAAEALGMIEPLAQRLAGYFYFFGLKGALLSQLGRLEEARTAFARAIALANTTAEAAHIRQHLDRLQKDYEKSTASVLPPQTTTPIRSPGEGW